MRAKRIGQPGQDKRDSWRLESPLLLRPPTLPNQVLSKGDGHLVLAKLWLPTKGIHVKREERVWWVRTLLPSTYLKSCVCLCARDPSVPAGG